MQCCSFRLFAVAGVFLGLWVTGTEFNITSRMGMTMIVGIVTEIAIFYYSEFRSLPASDDRLILAGINRMRAISMTTFAAILALLPLALGIGHGSAMQQPLAIAIISGLICSLPLVLIILPALLAIFDRKASTRSDPEKARGLISVSASGYVLQRDQSDRLFRLCRPQRRARLSQWALWLSDEISRHRRLQQWSMSRPETLRRKEALRPLSNRCCPDRTGRDGVDHFSVMTSIDAYNVIPACDEEKSSRGVEG